MFGMYFGHYLLGQGVLTLDQLKEVTQAQKTARVKLGLLAVTSGLLTSAQADEVNLLQTKMDKRFGDIAVEKGYLTEEQVGELLGKQGNAYLLFVQTLIEKGYMSLEQIEKYVEEFKQSMGYSNEDLECIKSGDLDRIVPLFMKDPNLSNIHKHYIALIMRNILRFIDTDIRMENVVKLQPIETTGCVAQKMIGDQSLVTIVTGVEGAMLDIASTYGREDFKVLDEDSLDAIGEFLNVCNGLFVSTESESGIEIDLEPPIMYLDSRVISSEGIAYQIPVYISGKRINIVFSVNADIEIA